jgi:hypothetical protein
MNTKNDIPINHDELNEFCEKNNIDIKKIKVSGKMMDLLLKDLEHTIQEFEKYCQKSAKNT